ncbi:MAG: hypothetical protein P4L16_07835 [Chlamydiales bacterium]|nr:hypothetical protein [Chlamydiales bacterium]
MQKITKTTCIVFTMVSALSVLMPLNAQFQRPNQANDFKIQYNPALTFLRGGLLAIAERQNMESPNAFPKFIGFALDNLSKNGASLNARQMATMKSLLNSGPLVQGTPVFFHASIVASLNGSGFFSYAKALEARNESLPQNLEEFTNILAPILADQNNIRSDFRPQMQAIIALNIDPSLGDQIAFDARSGRPFPISPVLAEGLMVAARTAGNKEMEFAPVTQSLNIKVDPNIPSQFGGFVKELNASLSSERIHQMNDIMPRLNLEGQAALLHHMQFISLESMPIEQQAQNFKMEMATNVFSQPPENFRDHFDMTFSALEGFAHRYPRMQELPQNFNSSIENIVDSWQKMHVERTLVPQSGQERLELQPTAPIAPIEDEK